MKYLIDNQEVEVGLTIHVYGNFEEIKCLKVKSPKIILSLELEFT